MDHCSQPNLLPLADALLQMLAALSPVAEFEQVTLGNALDRVLANPITSHIAVPSCDNSAMDGYAFRHADLSADTMLRIVGHALAGHKFDGDIVAGECVRIMTGAVLPTTSDTVVMQENTVTFSTPSGDFIRFITPPIANENIRRAGEDIKKGSVIFSQGHRLTPIDIGLLASLGIATINVYRKLRIALLSTGDELTPPGSPLITGNIYDSNRYALIALLQRLNIECIDLGLLPDNTETIAAALKKSAGKADAVISTGGVSVGDSDHTKTALHQVGTVHFWKVAMKPGKPFAFGSLNNNQQTPCWFFGLPGNPVSAVVTYHQLVLPALRRLAGEQASSPLYLTAIAGHDIKKSPGRSDFQRGVIRNESGINIVATTGQQSSGMLTSMTQANCYLVLAQESGSVKKGELVQVILFDKFLQ